MANINSSRKSWSARLQVLAATVAGGLLAAGTVIHVVGGGDSVETPAQASEKSKAPVLAPALDPKTLLAKGKWKTYWSDEFTGKGKPNPTKWFVQTGDRGGWGVGGLAYYHPNNTRRNGRGQLVLAATRDKSGTKCWYGRCKYRSGRIQTAGRFSLKYGRFAARVKFPAGQGIFPAFWMQSQNAPHGSKRYAEIDIAEIVGARPKEVRGAAHHTKRVRNLKTVLRKPVNGGFHTYGVDWSPTEIRWWVDGRVYGTLKRYKGWSFNQPMQIILNLQVGGKWQGPPNARTRFPAAMTIDWVRVYKPKG